MISTICNNLTCKSNTKLTIQNSKINIINTSAWVFEKNMRKANTNYLACN